MTTLVLQGDRRVLGVRADQLAVLLEGEVVAVRATEQVEEVHVYGPAQLSPAARELCLRRGIDVVFLAPGGGYLGRLSSRESAAGERRLAQLSTVLDPVRRLEVARRVVEGKLKNQATHLRRVQRRVRLPEVGDALGALHAAAARALHAPDLDALRGTEGLGARLYFEALGRGLSAEGVRFDGRTRRPPRDPVNAALSYAYTLLTSRVEGAVRQAGLDPYVGFLHEATRGNPACALDLVEEWRPLIDAMVFGLFNRRELGPEDFRTPGASLEAGPSEEDAIAVHLAPVGREILFRAWFRRMDDPVPVASADQRLPLRQALAWQAAHLARVCEGREAVYVPVRWE